MAKVQDNLRTLGAELAKRSIVDDHVPIEGRVIYSSRESVAEPFEIESEDLQNTSADTMPKQITAEVAQNNTKTHSENEQTSATLKEAYEKWETLTEEFHKVAAQIHQAHPKKFKKWGLLAEKLGKVTEQIQQTHAQEWEKMVTLLEELTIVEAQIQQAHTKEYKKIEKEY